MSFGLWLNTLSAGGVIVDIERQPEFTRNTLYGDIDRVVSNHSKRTKHNSTKSMDWESLGGSISVVDPLTHFKILSPKLTGELAPVTMEREVLRVSFDWFLQLLNKIEDQEVLEASVLLMAYITIPEEKGGRKITEDNAPLVFGYSLNHLLGIMGQVLVPQVLKRLSKLIIHSVNVQVDRNSSSRFSKSRLLRKLSTSYDNYLRWRAIDGYTEAFMLCVFAILGESCQQLTAGVANDIVEAIILIHDSHSTSRHFSEGEMANCHNYMRGGVDYSIPMALQRATQLRASILMDETIPDRIKEVGLMLISNTHTLGYSCARYKYGKVLAKLISPPARKPTPAPSNRQSWLFPPIIRAKLLNRLK